MSDLQAENRRIATIAYERIRLSIRRDMDDYQLLLSSGPDYCYLFKDKELRDKFGTYLLRRISNNILKLNIKEEIK